MRFAYADPPYFGCCKLYDHFHGDSGDCWDEAATHFALIDTLEREYPDGWAMSLSSPSLPLLSAYCPADIRIAAWVKPFASFKPNVNPGYCWEPVIFRGGRRGDRTRATVRDYVACNITLRKGLTGAKPEPVCDWILDLLGYEPGDSLADLFPGTGIMETARQARDAQAIEA